MKRLLLLAKQFRDDDSGAAMIEYTILIGIITAAVITSVIAVGVWVTGKWGVLTTALGIT